MPAAIDAQKGGGGTDKSASKRGPDPKKYARLKEIGFPMNSILNKMRMDGCHHSLIDQFGQKKTAHKKKKQSKNIRVSKRKKQKKSKTISQQKHTHTLLVFGYIRRIVNIDKNIPIPLDITQIISDYSVHKNKKGKQSKNIPRNKQSQTKKKKNVRFRSHSANKKAQNTEVVQSNMKQIKSNGDVTNGTDNIPSHKVDNIEMKEREEISMHKIETQQNMECEEAKHISNVKTERTVNVEILQQLQTMNSKFDRLVDAIIKIDQTLQEKQSKVPKQITYEVSFSKCIEVIYFIIGCVGVLLQFLVSLPFKLIFNLKIVALFTCVGIYLYQNQLNDTFGINVNGTIEWVRDHYIFPHQTIQKYLIHSEQNIKLITQYNRDINERFNIEIAEKWTEYVPKSEEYLKAFHKRIFYATENSDQSIRQLVLVGVTGTGKSLFGNRLSGYQGNVEENGYFGVSGDVDSCTRNISKLIVYNLHSVNISILDTPGIFDTKDDDIIHQHNLIEYLKGSGGVNAFILLLKKERLSTFIQNMLHQFEDKFGEEFWSHLMFVINFWNKRDEIGWKEWKLDFIKKIRKQFKLRNATRFPLPIIGINNYGSYRLEIQRDLIPNIPLERLSCDDFKSPLEILKNETVKLKDKMVWLVKVKQETELRLNEKCKEVKISVKKLQWFGNKVSDEQKDKIGIYSQSIESQCTKNMNQRITEIEMELGMESFTNEEDNNGLVRLETKSIDYNAFRLHKLSYLTESNNQYLMNCINQSMQPWTVNTRLGRIVEFLSKREIDASKLLDKRDICDAFRNFDENVLGCNKSLTQCKPFSDDGLRFTM